MHVSSDIMMPRHRGTTASWHMLLKQRNRFGAAWKQETHIRTCITGAVKINAGCRFYIRTYLHPRKALVSQRFEVKSCIASFHRKRAWSRTVKHTINVKHHTHQTLHSKNITLRAVPWQDTHMQQLQHAKQLTAGHLQQVSSQTSVPYPRMASHATQQRLPYF